MIQSKRATVALRGVTQSGRAAHGCVGLSGGTVIQASFPRGRRPAGLIFAAGPAARVAVLAGQPKTVIQRVGTSEAFPATVNLPNSNRQVGEALPDAVRRKMESLFNASFADVRIHIGPQAPSIGALAFTHGSNLYFAPGHYNPHSQHGLKLLGHELAHVVQQRSGRVRSPFVSGVALVDNGALEAEASQMGRNASIRTISIQARMRYPDSRSANNNDLCPRRVLARPMRAGRVDVIQRDKTFYHWMPSGSSSIGNALERRWMVAWNPRKAFWVFDLDQEYRPSMTHDYTLMAYTVDDIAAGNIMVQDLIDFEDEEFKGETKHPMKIIIKSNERGAYGIGATRLSTISTHVRDVRYATRREVAKALGKNTREVNNWNPGVIGW